MIDFHVSAEKSHSFCRQGSFCQRVLGVPCMCVDIRVFPRSPYSLWADSCVARVLSTDVGAYNGTVPCDPPSRPCCEAVYIRWLCWAGPEVIRPLYDQRSQLWVQLSPSDDPPQMTHAFSRRTGNVLHFHTDRPLSPHVCHCICAYSMCVNHCDLWHRRFPHFPTHALTHHSEKRVSGKPSPVPPDIYWTSLLPHQETMAHLHPSLRHSYEEMFPTGRCSTSIAVTAQYAYCQWVLLLWPGFIHLLPVFDNADISQRESKTNVIFRGEAIKNLIINGCSSVIMKWKSIYSLWHSPDLTLTTTQT